MQCTSYSVILFVESNFFFLEQTRIASPLLPKRKSVPEQATSNVPRGLLFSPGATFQRRSRPSVQSSKRSRTLFQGNVMEQEETSTSQPSKFYIDRTEDIHVDKQKKVSTVETVDLGSDSSEESEPGVFSFRVESEELDDRSQSGEEPLDEEEEQAEEIEEDEEENYQGTDQNTTTSRRSRLRGYEPFIPATNLLSVAYSETDASSGYETGESSAADQDNDRMDLGDEVENDYDEESNDSEDDYHSDMRSKQKEEESESAPSGQEEGDDSRLSPATTPFSPIRTRSRMASLTTPNPRESTPSSYNLRTRTRVHRRG